MDEPASICLADLRNELRLSQAEIATAMGSTHQSHYSDLERGRRPRVGADVIGRLVSAFNARLEHYGSARRISFDEMLAAVNETARRAAEQPAAKGA